MRTEPGVNIKKKSNFIVEEEDFLCLVNYSKHQLLFFPKKRNNNKIGEGVTSPTAHGKHFKFFSVVGLFHLVRAKKRKERNCRDTCHNVSLNLVVVEIPSGPNQIVWPAGRGISFDPDRRWPSFLLASWFEIREKEEEELNNIQSRI